MNTQTETPIAGLVNRIIQGFERIPYSLIAFIARFSIAAVFWKSGQTKVEGLAIDLVDGTFQLGWPRLADSTIPLFKSEYHVPLLTPEVAAHLAAFAEHFFPMLILLGLATRFSALALLGMTLTIQLFVYPDAYPTHGTWAAIFLLLMARGPGVLSLDHLLARHFRYRPL
ncbi:MULTISPECIES: DoxX family protein [unclassified Pseudomonas]|uniref:DoxX family protein n=1 Tax=unclassified Pseudomonas TaxID=196821 RepID=UPI000876454E|nr:MULTISPECIES: DoxX family protein [unclassified Pseudomonas]SCZ67741.1 putative oxidoreductase [Pseudomonas sp. NFPP17]SDA64076.1 putative oxidoreductase [Pseudomonas sp. NFPP15]SEL11416.1 putative oxidoreductase [Pseudomonas sp. NFPP18]SFA61671.1 putative oxidoreductase [Pseudomonas sp. NFPP13]SFT79985.1 putative oxidoreductase [Pseudomonas sp. NFPP25]